MLVISSPAPPWKRKQSNLTKGRTSKTPSAPGQRAYWATSAGHPKTVETKAAQPGQRPYIKKNIRPWPWPSALGNHGPSPVGGWRWVERFPPFLHHIICYVGGWEFIGESVSLCGGDGNVAETDISGLISNPSSLCGAGVES